jgi:hypothetical protein
MARYERTPAEHTQYAFAGMSLGVAPKSTDTDSPSGSHLEGGCLATGGPLSLKCVARRSHVTGTSTSA